MIGRIAFGAAMLGALAVGAVGGTYVAAANVAGQPSACVHWDDAKPNTGEWGEMRTFFTGDTYATQDAFVAQAVVNPGQAVHAAHQHAEEEYLVLMKGSGRWHLDGREFEAKEGDTLYIEPWVMHGLTNTSDEDLVFFVVKYNGRGVPVTPKPEA